MKQVKHMPHITRPVQPVSIMREQRRQRQRQRQRVHPRNTTPRFDEHQKDIERRLNRSLLSNAAVFKHQRDMLLFYGGILLLAVMLVASYRMIESTHSFEQLNKLYNECKMERDVYYSQLESANKQNEALRLEIERQQATIEDYEQQLSAHETYTY